MLVLVDTPVWSLALRRRAERLSAHEQGLTSALRELIEDGRAQLMGAVRQELLSGIRDESSFKKLRDQLRAFADVPIDVADYEEAARLNNQCRARGVAGSAIDFLICAVAIRRNWQIFTADRDFVHYAAVLPLKLYNAL
jgi:predicted nucleic acid-binding protein